MGVRMKNILLDYLLPMGYLATLSISWESSLSHLSLGLEIFCFSVDYYSYINVRVSTSQTITSIIPTVSPRLYAMEMRSTAQHPLVKVLRNITNVVSIKAQCLTISILKNLNQKLRPVNKHQTSISILVKPLRF